MSPYNAYSPSLSSSRLSTYTPSSRTYSTAESYSSLSSSSNYRYKPPTYSSTLSPKYRSSTSYSSPSTYTPSTLTRNVSSSYLATRVPRFDSVSSFSSAILNTSDYKWKSSAASSTSDVLWRSPSLSRRSSSSSLASLSHASDRVSRASLPAYTSSIDAIHISTNEREIGGNDGLRSGLTNLGNTCFMNAVLQCLCNIIPIHDYCLNEKYRTELNVRSPTHGELIRVFADFVKTICEPTSSGAFNPSKLRTSIQRYAPRFHGDTQQDAQEFLRYLLQGLHEDINRVKVKTISVDCLGGYPSNAWRRYKENDDSLIVDLFAGQLKSTLTCTLCKTASITYDPFWDLSLPIPAEADYKTLTLKDCFTLFSAPEFLDGSNKTFCDICRTKTRSSKKIEVNKLPKVLVIHLKRFKTISEKKNDFIDCPLRLASLNDMATSNSIGESCNYAMCGVVDHAGTLTSGHYLAKCRNPVTKEWIEYNDEIVKTASTVVTNRTYIVFYIQEGRF